MRIDIARHPETCQDGLPGKAGGGKETKNDNLSSFASDTAAKTGMDERTIQRATRRAERIVSDVKALIADTAIADSGVELDALAAASPSERRKMVEMVLSKDGTASPFHREMHMRILWCMGKQKARIGLKTVS
jgi:hypothetical protein